LKKKLFSLVFVFVFDLNETKKYIFLKKLKKYTIKKVALNNNNNNFMNHVIIKPINLKQNENHDFVCKQNYKLQNCIFFLSINK